MKSQARLMKLIGEMPRMTRGRLCVLSRRADGGKFYHLQYRKDTKLFQKYIPLDEVAAYEKSTEQFRIFTEAVDAYIDEMSALGMKEIRKEARDAKHKKRVGKSR